MLLVWPWLQHFLCLTTAPLTSDLIFPCVPSEEQYEERFLQEETVSQQINSIKLLQTRPLAPPEVVKPQWPLQRQVHLRGRPASKPTVIRGITYYKAKDPEEENDIEEHRELGSARAAPPPPEAGQGTESPLGPCGGVLPVRHTPFLQFDYYCGPAEPARLPENPLQLQTIQNSYGLSSQLAERPGASHLPSLGLQRTTRQNMAEPEGTSVPWSPALPIRR